MVHVSTLQNLSRLAVLLLALLILGGAKGTSAQSQPPPANEQRAVDSLRVVGHKQIEKGEWGEAATSMTAAAELAEKNKTHSDLTIAFLWFKAGLANHRADSLTLGLYQLNRAWGMAQELEFAQLEIAALAELASAHKKDGNLAKAILYARRAKRLAPEIVSSFQHAKLTVALGDYLLADGAVAEAVAYYQQAEQEFERLGRDAELADVRKRIDSAAASTLE